ncbi:hypothetical protein OH492_14055 [Vibrio chagasii]|nr:hypothetical protein [Vibrio chagasii]
MKNNRLAEAKIMALPALQFKKKTSEGVFEADKEHCWWCSCHFLTKHVSQELLKKELVGFEPALLKIQPRSHGGHHSILAEWCMVPPSQHNKKTWMLQDCHLILAASRAGQLWQGGMCHYKFL